MAKQCIFKSPDELPETLVVKHIENLLGVSRCLAYKALEEGGPIPKFHGGEREKILVNKHACLRAIGFQPLQLTEELAKTPLIWTVDRMAAYLGIHEQTFLERVKRKRAAGDGPYIFVGKRILCCREAFLMEVGYALAQNRQDVGLQTVA